MTTLSWIKILEHMQGLPANGSICTDSPEADPEEVWENEDKG